MATSPQIATFLSSSSSSSSSSSFSSSTFRFHIHTPSYSHISRRLPTPKTSSFSSNPIIITSPKQSFLFHHKPQKRKSRLCAAAEDTAIDVINTDEGGGASIVVSALFFIAFIGLSVITIGVIYLAVVDFLQKREKDKFEKEEATKTGKRKKKKVVRAGPKGFGQKIIDDIQDDD